MKTRSVHGIALALRDARARGEAEGTADAAQIAHRRRPPVRATALPITTTDRAALFAAAIDDMFELSDLTERNP